MLGNFLILMVGEAEIFHFPEIESDSVFRILSFKISMEFGHKMKET